MAEPLIRHHRDGKTIEPRDDLAAVVRGMVQPALDGLGAKIARQAAHKDDVTWLRDYVDARFVDFAEQINTQVNAMFDELWAHKGGGLNIRLIQPDPKPIEKLIETDEEGRMTRILERPMTDPTAS